MLSFHSDVIDENASVHLSSRKPPVSSGSALGKRPLLGKRKALGEITNVTPNHRAGSLNKSSSGDAFKTSKKVQSSSSPGPEDATLKKAKVVLNQLTPGTQHIPKLPPPIPSVLKRLSSNCPTHLHQTALEYAEDGVEIKGASWAEKQPALMTAQRAAMCARVAAILDQDIADLNAQMRVTQLDSSADDVDLVKAIPIDGWEQNSITSDPTYDTTDYLKSLQQAFNPEELIAVDVASFEDELFC